MLLPLPMRLASLVCEAEPARGRGCRRVGRGRAAAPRLVQPRCVRGGDARDAPARRAAARSAAARQLRLQPDHAARLHECARAARPLSNPLCQAWRRLARGAAAARGARSGVAAHPAAGPAGAAAARGARRHSRRQPRGARVRAPGTAGPLCDRGRVQQAPPAARVAGGPVCGSRHREPRGAARPGTRSRRFTEASTV